VSLLFPIPTNRKSNNMPKLFKLLRGQKRRSGSPSPGKKNGIFRPNTFSKKSKKKKTTTTTTIPVIEAAITYSLSEDEESCGIILSPTADIENQCHVEESKEEDSKDDEAVQKANGSVLKEITDIEVLDPVQSNTNDSSIMVKENDKVLTFTHLEVMRNELAHMMQIAIKDKEIHELKQDADDLKVRNQELVASKDVEIMTMKEALVEAESSLSVVKDKLSTEERENAKIIDVLMETQYEFHELKNKSCFAPFFCC